MNNDIRRTELFCKNWLFCLGDFENAQSADFDDSDWQPITLPHDYSICGEFSWRNPTTARGGYLTSGIGWYRKHFKTEPHWHGKKVEIEFEGIYRHAIIWLNGIKIGYRPNGWVAQRYDITDCLHYDGRENVIAVRADNSDQPASRYYTGAGIYRDVSVITRGKTYIENGEPYIVATPRGGFADIAIQTEIGGEKNTECRLEFTLFNADGEAVATGSDVADQAFKSNFSLSLSSPILWSIENPYLYTLKTTLFSGDTACDEVYTRIGIRSIEFYADKGFFLNGKRVQVQGVCLHHDNGCLGAAAFKDADRRRISIMKEMGANAIRLSHNPFAKSFLDLCDEMGMLVMAEAFDEWRMPKCIPALKHTDMNLKLIVHNYYTDFDRWHETDLSEFIIRERNHPSIFMWSIGNEIAEQRHNVAEGIETAKMLKAIVKRYDSTRPVTAACCLGNAGTRDSGFLDVLDVAGYNYEDNKYEEHKKLYPDTKVIGSETTSLTWFRKRGWYDPELFGYINDEYRRNIRDNGGEIIENADIEDNVTRRLLIGEHSMQRHLNNPHVAGMFIWTGMDYIGEPTPYTWPSRSSYFGVTDTCGFPKDAFYYYQSKWSEKAVLHCVTHWNWEGYEGKKINIIAFSNCESAELFLNGKSFGVCKYDLNYADHLHWEVPYEVGTLSVVGYKNGEAVAETIIKTADRPYAVRLSADRYELSGDGRSLAFITADIVDKNGNIVPNADNSITFSAENGITLCGVDNGDPEYVGSLKSDTIPALAGKCLAVVRASGKTGCFTVRAQAKGLCGGSLILTTR